MRKATLFIVILLSTVCITTGRADALTISDLLNVNTDEQPRQEQKIDKPEEPVVEAKPIEKVEIKYTVVKGDTLQSIAQKAQIDWRRLYYKNLDIKDQNQIDIGMELIIPDNEEVLDERELVVPPAIIATQTTSQPPRKVFGSVSYSNTYTKGYCTYGVATWVKIPNNWGNANQWAYNARVQGYRVDDKPEVGAVAQTSRGSSGHVALVIAVTGDNVTIKEMNFRRLNVISTRTVPSSSFRYIHL